MCSKRKTESAEAVVARGAAVLDVVFGPKWFRTEVVSLARVTSSSVFAFLFEKLGLNYETLTTAAEKKGYVFAPGQLFDLASELKGAEFGFYRGPDDLNDAWADAIRARRYNRPAKRRVSTKTARTTRAIANTGVTHVAGR